MSDIYKRRRSREEEAVFKLQMRRKFPVVRPLAVNYSHWIVEGVAVVRGEGGELCNGYNCW